MFDDLIDFLRGRGLMTQGQGLGLELKPANSLTHVLMNKSLPEMFKHHDDSFSRSISDCHDTATQKEAYLSMNDAINAPSTFLLLSQVCLVSAPQAWQS